MYRIFVVAGCVCFGFTVQFSSAQQAGGAGGASGGASGGGAAAASGTPAGQGGATPTTQGAAGSNQSSNPGLANPGNNPNGAQNNGASEPANGGTGGTNLQNSRNDAAGQAEQPGTAGNSQKKLTAQQQAAERRKRLNKGNDPNGGPPTGSTPVHTNSNGNIGGQSSSNGTAAGFGNAAIHPDRNAHSSGQYSGTIAPPSGPAGNQAGASATSESQSGTNVGLQGTNSFGTSGSGNEWLDTAGLNAGATSNQRPVSDNQRPVSDNYRPVSDNYRPVSDNQRPETTDATSNQTVNDTGASSSPTSNANTSQNGIGGTNETAQLIRSGLSGGANDTSDARATATPPNSSTRNTIDSAINQNNQTPNSPQQSEPNANGSATATANGSANLDSTQIDAPQQLDRSGPPGAVANGQQGATQQSLNQQQRSNQRISQNGQGDEQVPFSPNQSNTRAPTTTKGANVNGQISNSAAARNTSMTGAGATATGSSHVGTGANGVGPVVSAAGANGTASGNAGSSANNVRSNSAGPKSNVNSSSNVNGSNGGTAGASTSTQHPMQAPGAAASPTDIRNFEAQTFNRPEGATNTQPAQQQNPAPSQTTLPSSPPSNTGSGAPADINGVPLQSGATQKP